MTRFDGRLLAGTAFAAVVLAAAQAHAGAFGIREQSTEGIGVAYAGVAAGGVPSSMFYNPATMTQIYGMGVETDVTGIFPNSKTTTAPFPASTFGPGSPLGAFPDPQMNIGPAAAVPAATIIRQLTPDLWIGLGINSPFGLTTGTPDSWPGRFYGEQATFESFNFNPTIAYKINNWISVGAGVQAQYATTNQTFGLPVPTPTTGQLNLSGSGWGFGFTAGVTVNPWAGTTLGLGYRSFINQTIDGTLTVPLGLPATTGGAINSTVRLPDQLSGGIKQRINDQWTLLGTVEWDNWSRIGTTTVNTAAGGPALVVGTPLQLPFQYRDGWLFSGGVEYNAAPGWVLRGGAGYEISPITTGVRIPALPDSNRIWLTAGLTKAIFPGLYLDLSYAHLFMQNADMNITSLANNPWFDGVAYTGTAVNHIDILSLGLRLQLSPPPPTPLVTKG